MQQAKFYGCLFFLITLLPAQLHAQLSGYREYRPGDKNTKLFSLFKSREGYLYTGTGEGLYRFDGILFSKIELNRPGATDTITAIFQDRNKDIWVGCNSGRIAKTVNRKLQYIDPEEGTPKKRITSFVQDKSGNTWFGTAGEGLYHFYNNRLYLINDENGLSDLNIHSLAITENGEVLATTDQGINICSFGANKASVKVIGPSNGLPDYIVTSIYPAGNNSFWIGMQDRGFCLYDHQAKKVLVPAAAANWNKGQVNDLYFTHNKLWIATQDSGLLCYSATTQKMLPLLNAQQKTVGNITEDNQGNMWFVSDNTILAKAASNALQVYPLYKDDFYYTVHTILVDNENNIWTGTDLAVVKHTFVNGSFVSKKYPVHGLDMKTDITSLYQDQYNNIWVGAMGKGAFVLDPATGKTRQLKEAGAGNSILSITGSGNTVCIAGLEGAMVFELGTENAHISNEYHFTSYNKIETIGSNYIYSVFKDSKDNIWFATDGKGLTKLSKGLYTHYNKANGIKDEHIYSVAEDHTGKIWFSTSNAGVYAFDGRTFTNYAVKEGLSSLQISAIKTDRLGNIVVVHKNGLDIIDSKTGRISYINTAHGISEINDDLGAVCTDAAGNIFIATRKGIVQYEALQGTVNTPQIMIESVQLFLNDIDTAVMHHFKYDENNFRFNFTGLYYTSPERVFYEYKLEDLYSSWQFTSDNSKAFPKLPPGKYIFKVRASLNKNFANATEASFAFDIAQPFWRTWWFFTTVMLATGGLLYWYIKKRERQVTQVQELKNQKVKFEFEVLRNQVNPHFLFNSFNTLISTIENDPRMGVEYVEQLSDFFRNIVNYRDKDTISLQEELMLLQNYLYLQQKRYGSSLKPAIHVSEEEQKNIFLPPLTLQLLVENAIKHNVVSKEAVLHIEVLIKDDCLVVRNNINKKMNKEKGTGMGLQNIKGRYALLQGKPVVVSEVAGYFTVSLPILKR
jgi:ligand-binding sensor domain-containing protein